MAESCGRNDCPWNNSTNLNLEKPESRTVFIKTQITTFSIFKQDLTNGVN